MDDERRPGSAPTGDIAQALIANLPFALVLADPYREDMPIVYVNRTFEMVTGYSASSVIGRNCRFLQGEMRDQKARHELSRAIKAREPAMVDIENVRADGTKFMNRLMVSPVYDETGRLFTFVGVQTELTQGDSDPQATTARAFSMLRETEHRVKNHLSMVASMIRLEGRGSDSHVVFDMLARRVETLSLLYDEFSKDTFEDAAHDVVSAGGYIGRVASTIGSIEGRKAIRLNVDCDTVYMRSNDAAALGLLASEILSNTYKHAFHGRSEGLIEVRLKMLGNDVVRLTINDDGVGMNGDWPKSGNDGAAIVRGLVDQVGGEIGVDTGIHGTMITVSLPYSLPTERSEDATRRVVGPAADEITDQRNGTGA